MINHSCRSHVWQMSDLLESLGKESYERSSRYLASGTRTTIVSTLSVLKPGSIPCRRRNFDQQACTCQQHNCERYLRNDEALRSRRLPLAWPDSDLPPSLSESLRLSREICSAGAKPKITPVSKETRVSTTAPLVQSNALQINQIGRTDRYQCFYPKPCEAKPE